MRLPIIPILSGILQRSKNGYYLSTLRGQRPETREKYRAAIEACDSEEYIHLNVSQVARLFHLSGPALANQLRAHYPDVIARREAERLRRGLADNIPRGVRKTAEDAYAQAVEMLRRNDMTLEEVADQCGVSYSGLRQHIIFYHKDVAALRDVKRQRGKATPRIGQMSGNGQVREMSDEIGQKYARGVELYRTTSLPVTEIARLIGVNVNTFRNHLEKWHRNLMFERRGAQVPAEASDRAAFGNTKRYSRSTSDKYAAAIELLRTTDTTTEAVAKKFGFIPEVFRAYLKEHEPALFESLGMITLPNGRQVLRRSYEKYRPAIEAIEANPAESIKTIAARYGLTYNSLTAFIRRNCSGK